MKLYLDDPRKTWEDWPKRTNDLLPNRPAAAVAAAEFGEADGHPFRGNQYSDGTGDGDPAPVTRDTPLGKSLLDYSTSMEMSAEARRSAEAGSPNDDAKRILAEVERSATDAPVHRGVVVAGGLDAAASQFAVGAVVDVRMGSFTTDLSISQKFAQWSRDSVEGEKTEVFLTAPKGTHGMKVPYDDLGLDDYFSQEKETIVAGQFRVKEITRGTVSDYYEPDKDERSVLNVVLEIVK